MGSSLTEPYSAKPGDPVFLLEGSTLEDYWAIRRRVNPLVKSSRNPVMVKDRDWEGIGPYLYGSVLYESQDKLFRCWYTVYHDEEFRKDLSRSYSVCYATSKDGYSWRKPELGVLEWKGSRKNNFIRLGRKKVEGITVIPTPPGSGIAQRFVAVYLDAPGVCLAYSDNGTDWVEHEGNPIEPSESDCHNSLVYDPRAHRWMVHHRPGLYASFTKRRIAVMESPDLKIWSRPETVLLPDEADPPEFYSMPVFQRGNLFFGLLHLFNRKQGSIEVELVFSPDGRSWHRVPPRELFLSRGQAGEFDRGMVVSANSPVIAHGEMRFYYGGFNGDHNQPVPGKASIGLASVPLDRLFGMTNSSNEEPGVILTRPLLLNGESLSVNATVRGQMKVAILDLAGKELPGFGLENCQAVGGAGGDDFRLPVSWSGGRFPTRNNQPLRLRFQLEKATFYAFYIQ
jgi:hypothetical protein